MASDAELIVHARRALERALNLKVWNDDGWEVPAIDVQEALDILNASQSI